VLRLNHRWMMRGARVGLDRWVASRPARGEAA
jgi:hypothetical protein